MSGYESPPAAGGFHPNAISANPGVLYGNLSLAVKNKLMVALQIEKALGNTYITGSLALYLHQHQNNKTGKEPRDLDIVRVVQGRVTAIPTQIAGWTEIRPELAWVSPVLQGGPAGVTYKSLTYDFTLDVITTSAQAHRAKVLNDTVRMFNVRVATLGTLKRFYESDAYDKMSPVQISAAEKVRLITELQEEDAT